MNNNSNKRVKQGKLEIDYKSISLIVNYEVETFRQDERGLLIVVDSKPNSFSIPMDKLSVDENLAQKASIIVEKYNKHIHPSRVEEIEQLLIKLRKYLIKNPPSTEQQSSSDNFNKPNSNNITKENNKQQKVTAPKISALDQLPPADMNKIDDYLEMLYQVSGKNDKERLKGLQLQEEGTGMILKLCRDVMNLEMLIQNSTVMGALTRVLQEEYKKSTELTFNILRTFLAFSNFAEMHSLMANYRVGVLTMKAIEFEIKRAEHRNSEKEEKEKEYNKELQEAKQKGQNEYSLLLEKIRKLKEKESSEQKQIQRKRDKLLFVAFYILLNLAEDISVERKMIKKGLIESLTAMLSHNFEDLLILCITFLKKLSTIEENKNVMKESNLVDILSKNIPCSSQPLVMITLRFLFNLSFDKEIREQMIKGGYVPKLINLLKIPAYRAKTLKLLYHLSVDDRCKSMFTYTDGIPILIGMVINFPQDFLAKELAALMVNLSHNNKNTELMIANKGLNLLMDRFADKRDPLLLKIIRNISQWTFDQQQESENPELNYRYRGLWSHHIKVLLEICTENDVNHDILVEIFGCLANMTIHDLPATSNWSKLLKDYSLISLFNKLLVSGMAQNDLLLEIIMIIANIASDVKACSQIVSHSTIISQLEKLWEEKGDDVEILLQLIHCFHKFFLHKESREEAMYNTRVVVKVIECLSHRSYAIRQKADELTAIVLEFDRKKNGEPGQLGQEIIRRRFESFNKVWLANNNNHVASYNDVDDFGGIRDVNINSLDMDEEDARYHNVNNSHYYNGQNNDEWKADGKTNYFNGVSEEDDDNNSQWGDGKSYK